MERRRRGERRDVAGRRLRADTWVSVLGSATYWLCDVGQVT